MVELNEPISSEYKSTNYIIYLDTLSVFSVCFLLLHRVKCKKKISVCYFNQKTIPDVFKRFLKIFQIYIDDEPIRQEFGDLWTSKGDNLIYDASDLMKVVYNSVHSQTVLTDTLETILEASDDQDLFKHYLKASLQYELEMTIRLLCLFNAIVSKDLEDQPKSSTKYMFVFASLPLIDCVFQHYQLMHANTNIYLDKYLCMRHLSSIMQEIYALGHWLARIVISISKEMLNKLFRIKYEKSVENSSQDRPQIAVQALHGLNFNDGKYHDLFWFVDSKLELSQILLYLNRPTSLSYSSIVAQAKSHGIKSVIWPKWIPIFDKYVLRDLKQLFYSVLHISFSTEVRTNSYRWWTWVILLKMLRWTFMWTTFFRQHNVKIHMSVDQGAICVPQYWASTRNGGIELTRQWSSGDYTHSEFLSPLLVTHVFFPWSRFFDERPRLLGYDIHTSIIVGHFQGVSTDKDDDSIFLAKRYDLNKKCDYIISIFDNNFQPHICYSTKMMQSFYEFFLDWADIDETIGLVIKPKNISDLEKLSYVGQRIHILEEKGQAILLPTWISPTAASSISAISIGIGISSPILHIVGAGYPGIHLDLSRFWRNYLYSYGEKTYIFDKLDTLKKLLEKHHRDPHKHSWLGDHSNFSEQLDPFKDENGGKRMGQYIYWFMDAVERGGMRQSEAIGYANECYRQNIGEEFIICPLEPI